MEFKYKFSVVMAVYNVKPFLKEAVESLVAQDIGFSQIQLIMVDDGSTDGSADICDSYAQKYPENVLALHKENGGVSSARNLGLAHVQGEYVNFLDADDKLTPNTMLEVYKFFSLHRNEVDVVSIPLVFFDGQQGEHILNYKYSQGNRVIDLNAEYNAIQLSMSSAFVKAEVLAGEQFDTRLAYAEDAKVIQNILLNRQKLGVVSTCHYCYRRRSEKDGSAIQASTHRQAWYLPYLRHFQQELIQYCMDRVDAVPLFVQFALAYDLQWRIKLSKIPQGVLSDREAETFKETLYVLLEKIDDQIILEQQHIETEHKLFILQKKYNHLPTLQYSSADAELSFHGQPVAKLSQAACCLEFISITNSRCTLEGYFDLYPLGFEGIRAGISIDGKDVVCEMTSQRNPKLSLGEAILERHGFLVTFPLEADRKAPHTVSFFLVLDGHRIENNNLTFGKFFPLSVTYKTSYSIQNGWEISKADAHLCFRVGSVVKHFMDEVKFLKEVWAKNLLGSHKAVAVRCLAAVLKCFKRKPVWLISDRVSKADDNGEAFFLYMQKEHPEIRTYFMLSSASPDFERMKQKGPILDYLTTKQKLALLLADCIISSQAEDEVRNPFGDRADAYKDILTRIPFVFLQHGVIKDDLSNWLKRYNKNFAGFVTSAIPEYSSIVNGNYEYAQKEIWLTGLPRFDRLYHQEQKYITIMPTWRKYLMGKLDMNTGIWSLGADFQKSEYFKFYSDLLNSERLIKAVKQYGYTLRFFLHPNIIPYITLFDLPKDVAISSADTHYRTIYKESALVVTDYSSAVFDFAYLRKPILYTQFDAATFFSGMHSYEKGYFEYERDGFGEVEYDLESTIDRIIEYMQNGCQLKDKYRERIDKFFAFNDRNNCQRVYKKIAELAKE